MKWLPRIGLILLLGVALPGCNFGSGTSFLQVGTKAPAIETKTLADVGGDLSRITTYRAPDKRMYQMSLDEAMKTGKPILLEFATPAHCTVCDKQLQMLKALLNKYEDEMIFLHMDQYQNTIAYKTFGVKGDPWTYVIDGDSTVRFVRSGRMLYGELESAIQKVLRETS